MRFTAERDVLLPALSFVRKYAASNAKVPILADVLIEARDGRVTFTATDLDQSAVDSFSADVTHPGAITVSVAGVHDAIKSAVGADVVMDADDRQVRISCGKSKFKLSIMPGADFPPLPMLSSDAVTEFTIPNVAEIDRRVRFAAKASNNGEFTEGVSWKIAGNDLEFAATDGRRMAVLAVPAPAGAGLMPSIIVPRFDVPEWEGEISVAVSRYFIRIRMGNQIVATKLLEGTFPDYRRVIPANPVSLLFDRKELLAAVSRMSIVQGAGYISVLFVGRDGIASISATSAGRDAYDEVPYSGDDFQIAVTQHVIMPILASFDCETIELRFLRHDAAITVHNPSDANQVAVAVHCVDNRIAPYIATLEAA